jgi:hypothetical protein
VAGLATALFFAPPLALAGVDFLVAIIPFLIVTFSVPTVRFSDEAGPIRYIRFDPAKFFYVLEDYLFIYRGFPRFIMSTTGKAAPVTPPFPL